MIIYDNNLEIIGHAIMVFQLSFEQYSNCIPYINYCYKFGLIPNNTFLSRLHVGIDSDEFFDHNAIHNTYKISKNGN